MHYQFEKSEAFYKAVLQSVEDAVVVFDEAGQVVAVNDSAGTLFGYDEPLIAKSLDTFIFDASSSDAVSDAIQQSPEQWTGIRKKLRARHPQQGEFPVYVTVNQVLMGDERLFTAVIRDISERTELRRQLSSMGAKLNVAIYGSVIGFGTLDAQGQFLDANQQFMDWVGESALENLCEKNMFAFIHPDQSEQFSEGFRRVLSGAVSKLDTELKFLSADGQEYWLFMSLSKVVGQGEEGDSLVFQTIDIQRERELLNQVERKNEELRQRNEDLDQFAYMASHDLKSPLNAIVKLIGWIREDAQEAFDDTVNGHFKLIESRAHRMVNLLDALLLYSRVGRKEYGYEQVNFKTFVEDIFEFLDHSEKFALSCDDLVVYLPVVPFQIVVRNLLSNAIKHHHTGEGHLSFTVIELSGCYVITATDDGPGIPENLQSKALEVFQTLKPRDEVEGSGVGLPLIEKIVHRYGGRMQLQSDGQSGTSVILHWPIVALPGESG